MASLSQRAEGVCGDRRAVFLLSHSFEGEQVIALLE